MVTTDKKVYIEQSLVIFKLFGVTLKGNIEITVQTKVAFFVLK